jgi:hypothetical protein
MSITVLTIISSIIAFIVLCIAIMATIKHLINCFFKTKETAKDSMSESKD